MHRLRFLLSFLLYFGSVVYGQAPPTVTFAAGHLTLGDGVTPVPDGTRLCVMTVDASGRPSGYRVGSGSGQSTASADYKTCKTVSGGAIPSFSLLNSAATSPANACIRVSLFDARDVEIRRDPCVQTGTAQAFSTGFCTGTGSITCNYDSYASGGTPLTVQTQGPRGQQGQTGPAGASGSIVVNPVTGDAATVLAGTKLHMVAASNGNAFASKVPWLQLMHDTSDYFKGRTTVQVWGALGDGPDQELASYNAHVKADCVAYKAGGSPAWLVVETNVNHFTSASDQYARYQTLWATAQADGCPVFATTASDYFLLPQVVRDLNAMILAAPVGSTQGGGFASNVYAALLNLYAALPYDGCTDQTDGSCPTNPNGSFADTGHFNPRGASSVAGYAACVLVTRGTCGVPASTGINWQPGTLWQTVGTATGGKDWPVYTVPAGQGSVGIVQWALPGMHFVIANPAGNPPVQLTTNAGVANYVFADTGTTLGRFLAPGETVFLLADLPAGQTQGQFHEVASFAPRIPFVETASSTNTQIFGYAGTYDCAGFQTVVDGGPNGPAPNQHAPYHSMTWINNSGTACSFLAAVPINGGGTFTLPAHRSVSAVFVSSSAGWLVTAPAP